MAHDGEALVTEDYDQAPRLENKRKFDETADEPAPGNFNGNSLDGGESAPTSAVTYNSVPPPLSEFEQAKQKAALIAARLVGAEVKRPRTEENSAEDHNGSGRTNGLDLGQTFAGKYTILHKSVSLLLSRSLIWSLLSSTALTCALCEVNLFVDD